MTEDEFNQIANPLMEKYAPEDWKIEFQDEKLRGLVKGRGMVDLAAVARQSDKTIHIHRPILDSLTKVQAINLMCHELAHARLPHIRGHKTEWREECRKLLLLEPESQYSQPL